MTGPAQTVRASFRQHLITIHIQTFNPIRRALAVVKQFFPILATQPSLAIERRAWET
jgi:hypothetical protein